MNDIRERWYIDRVEENKDTIVNNINRYKEKYLDSLNTNDGILEINKSYIFKKIVNATGKLYFIETKSDSVEEKYDDFLELLRKANELELDYNSYKRVFQDNYNFGIVSGKSIKDIFVEDYYDFNVFDYDFTEVNNNEDIYSALKEIFGTSDELKLFEWKSLNHIDWYVLRPFWFKIIDEKLLSDNLRS